MAGGSTVRKALVVLAAILCCLETVRSAADDAYMLTSFSNLMKLYYMEEESLSNVDVFLREELMQHGDQQAADAAHNLTALRKLVDESKAVHRQVGGRTKEFLSHPVNVFHLAQRLRRGWKDAIDVIRTSKACREWHIPHVITRLGNIEQNLPTEADLKALAYNLVTIQHMQRIKTKDLLQGQLGGHKALAPISLQEQFEVARIAVDEDDYYYAAQWLKHLSKSGKLQQMTREEDGFNATNVLGMLASSYFRINLIQEAVKSTDDLLKKDPENSVALTNKAFYAARIASGKAKAAGGRPTRYGKEDLYRKNYEKLCRGTNVKPSRLKCRLEPTWPGSRLSFIKLEELKRRPPIVAFHGVVSRRNAELLVDVAEEEYEKEAMDSEQGFKTPEFTLVLSKVGLKKRHQLQKYQSVMTRVNQQLASLPYTVTKPVTSGEAEARNFGHQGFYIKPKSDFKIQSLGGHTGSAMVFLNDVEMGGDIVFPKANVRVAPQIGTVVFYFPSLRKFHAVCPVAYGTEWVLIRSFFERRAPELCRPHEDPSLEDSSLEDKARR